VTTLYITAFYIAIPFLNYVEENKHDALHFVLTDFYNFT